MMKYPFEMRQRAEAHGARSQARCRAASPRPMGFIR